MARLAQTVLAETPWSELRMGHRAGEEVAADLMSMLFDPTAESGAAYTRLEGDLVSQHDLFEGTPAAVAVIAAAVHDGSVVPTNLGQVLDTLLRILGGWSAPSEVAIGRTDLMQRCYAEAQRAYWSFVRLAGSGDPRTRADGAECVQALDADFAFRFSGWAMTDHDRLRAEGRLPPTPPS